MKNLRESYKLYKEIVKEPVDIQTYLILTAEYNKFLINKVQEGKEVTLPSRMGTLSIIGRKTKIRFDENGNIEGLAPDWVKTKALWKSNPEAKAKRKRIFHINSNTDGVRYKYLWSKKNVLVENKTLYSLRLTRTNKRTVHTKIVDGAQYKTI
tara:strand:- start:931 stop:1389 length:459 start_codon:yes stop_codon:yes gene_type:complete